MPYGTIYRIRYEERDGEKIVCHICDNETFDPDAVTDYIDLQAAKSGINVSVVDDDRNKFNPIRAKKAEINFLSSEDATASTFAEGEDSRWFVSIFIEGSTENLFQGFLRMDGHQQAFLEVGTYIVNLVANDGLGLIKDKPLVKPDGTNPRGYYKIIEYIAWCLQATGLQLPIIVTNSVMDENYQGECLYEVRKLYAKTFEKDINISWDPYTVLSRIFGYDCQVFQQNGRWWIGRVGEMTGNLTYAFEFDYEGNLLSAVTPTEYSQMIGRTEAIKWANKDCTVSFTRPYSSAKLNYYYRTPKEIIDNIDFARGTWLSVVSLGNPLWAAYELEDWTMTQNGVVQTITATAYIVRKFKDLNWTYEEERYLRVGPQSFIYTPRDYLQANPIPVQAMDKAAISVDYRREVDLSLTGTVEVHIFALYLHGTNNIWYRYRSDTNRWQVGTSSLNSVDEFTRYQYNGTDFDERMWQTASYDLPPFPHDGELYIGLKNGSSVSIPNLWINYKNLRFEYIPYINGDYSRYEGHYNKVSQPGDYKNILEDEVYLGDSPKPLFQGTMFNEVSPGNHEIAEDVYAGGDLANQGITPPIPSTYLHPFGFLQIFTVWNQLRRRFIELDGSLLGLRLTDGDQAPDLHRNYEIDVAVPEVEGKSFVLLAYDHDYHSGLWKGTFAETWSDDEGTSYSDQFLFKYINQY